MAAIRIRREIAVRAGSLNLKEYGGNARLLLITLKPHPGFDINLLDQFDTHRPLQTEVAEPRMIGRTRPLWPVKLALRLLYGHIVDGGVAVMH
jgi:hypothetical protein